MIKNEAIVSYPLSEIQKGILFESMSRDYIKDPLYVVQNVFKINGNFDSRLFLRAFNIVINRHELLKSCIVKTATGYIQVVYNQIDLPCNFQDYSNFSTECALELFEKFIEADRKSAIDLFKKPLMRLAIIKINNERYQIVWTRHHILMGGASAQMVVDEIFTVYCAELKKSKWILPTLKKYQEIFLGLDKKKAHFDKKYWINALNEYSNAALLPVIPSNYLAKNEMKHIRVVLEGETYRQLINFIQVNLLSVNTVLLGASAIALSHYSDKDAVILGSVRAYSKEEVGNVAGLFINTLPIYINIDHGGKIFDYLHGIKIRNKQLRKHIYSPLNKIKKCCKLPANAQLFQCVVDYKSSSLNTLMDKHFPGSKCSAYINLVTPYPLVFEVINEGSMLLIRLHYNTHLFEENYMHSLLDHFKYVLIKIISDKLTYISELPTLSQMELAKIMKWNKTDTINLKEFDRTIHGIFEEQVSKTPNAIAILSGKKKLTYEKLNLQANQLANYLIQHGIKTEDCVAICLKPSFDMMVAILGVLKAGGIYFPIDTNFPVGRVVHLLNNSQVKFIITTSEFVVKLNQFYFYEKLGSLIVNLDELETKHYSSSNPMVAMNSKNGMYVIYTSGSTGQPKGVLVEHKSTVNIVQACIRRLKIDSSSRILQIASPSFDVSVIEWTMALLSGATLCLIDKDMYSPDIIIEALKNYKITTIILASSILSVLPKENLPNLKTIAVGGEACAHAVIEFWAKARVFINVYGITEATICSTMADFSYDDFKSTDIGRPLSNIQVYILSRHLKPVPIGVVGEMYIGGIGIARGYINHDKLNNEKFVYTEMIQENKNKLMRLYKTGDYGRWLPDGHLECLGRVDQQIKIRGARVELLEIEQVFEKHPSVEKAVVTVAENLREQQLYAYILPSQYFVDIDQISDFIKSYLPSYMVPTKIFQLRMLPLTINGKVDKEKLPLNIIEDCSNELKYDALELFKLQETIKSVVQAVLGFNHISIDSNFLDLGFESLSLTKLAVELSSVLGKKIDILDLFMCANIGALSLHILRKNVFKQPCQKEINLNSRRIVFADE